MAFSSPFELKLFFYFFYFELLVVVSKVTQPALAHYGAPDSDTLQTFYTTSSTTAVTYSLSRFSLPESDPPFVLLTQQVRLICNRDPVKARRHQA